jgi:four helix bundle protein
MDKTSNNQFNEQLRERTMKMAVEVRNLLVSVYVSAIDRPIVNQLIRCSSSVAANYRSATRGRSDAEFYSKICIVVEEADETLFWIEFLTRIGVIPETLAARLMDELNQLVRLFASIKRKMREKLDAAGKRHEE